MQANTVQWCRFYALAALLLLAGEVLACGASGISPEESDADSRHEYPTLQTANEGRNLEQLGHKLEGVEDQKVVICNQAYPGIPYLWKSDRKELALTFDDGPRAAELHQILNILNTFGVKATFFLNTFSNNSWLGPFLSEANQAAVHRIASEGHDIGSHSATHPHLELLSPAEIDNQIEWAIGNITTVTGAASVPLFRAPYGTGYYTSNTSTATASQLHLWNRVRQHHVHVHWSFSGDDFNYGGDANCTQKLLAAYAVPVIQQGIQGVVLMHSTPNGFGGCPDALSRTLQMWQDAGYKFVLVSDVVRQVYGMPPAQVVQKARACKDSHTNTAKPVP